jgi:hypothetical protein
MNNGFRGIADSLLYLFFAAMFFLLFVGAQEKPTSPYEILGRIGIQEATNKNQAPYQFAGIISIDCDASGKIYVLDYKDVCVKVFDKTGRFIRRMFRPGKGPEELSAPSKLLINRLTGRLFIIQENGFQMKEFDPEGGFVKSYALPS